MEGRDFKIFFNRGEEISQFWPLWHDWIKNFLQPRWRNHLRFWVNLQHLEGLDFKIFFQPWWRNHFMFLSQFGAFRRNKFQHFLRPKSFKFLVNLEHLEGLDFKIFFNHGEEISQFWPFWQNWIKNFFNHSEEITVFESSWSMKDWISKFSSTMNVGYSWIFLQITEELTVKLPFPRKNLLEFSEIMTWKTWKSPGIASRNILTTL